MSKVKDYAEEIYGEEYPDITKDNNYGLWYWRHPKVLGNARIRKTSLLWRIRKEIKKWLILKM